MNKPVPTNKPATAPNSALQQQVELARRIAEAINAYLPIAAKLEGPDVATVKAMAALADSLGTLVASFPDAQREEALKSVIERIVQSMVAALTGAAPKPK